MGSRLLVRVLCAAALAAGAARPLPAQGFVGEIENVPDMVELMRDEHPDFRGTGAWMVGIFGTRAWPAVPALVARLGDRDGRVRQEACEALVRMDVYAVEDLRKALRSPRPRLRAGAAYTLGLIGAPGARDALPELGELASDPVPEVRWKAFDAARRITGGRR